MALKRRIIPVLLLKGGLIVRSEEFRYHQVIGDPTTQLTRYSDWEADELVYLDISRGTEFDVGRADAKIATEGKTDVLDVLEDIAAASSMPLTVGGGIATVEDMHERFRRGADKVAINTLAIDDIRSVGRAVEVFGSQAVVVSIDATRRDGGWRAVRRGTEVTHVDAIALAQAAEAHGAGEILLNSVDRDGTADGYDLALVERACSSVRTIPVVAVGGAGRWAHLAQALEAGADAVAAANIFHFTEMSYRAAKAELARLGVPVRPSPPPASAR